MIVDAGQAKRRGVECRGRLSVRTERFAIKIEFGVELAGAPTCQNFLRRRLIDFEHLCKCTEVGRNRNDLADVQVAVRPAV